MKNILLIFTAALAICMSACQKWEKPSTPESVSVLTAPQKDGESSLGGTRPVTIAATSAWTAVSDKGWLYATPSSGAKGINEVTVHFNKNTTGERRTGTITFTCGDHTETFTITQNR